MSIAPSPARPAAGSPFTLETILRSDLDLDRVVREIPDAYVIKGLFVARLMPRISPDAWAAVKPLLKAPPRTGRYLPFSDYSQSDYHRLLLLAARSIEPKTLPLPEQLRRLAREDFTVFGETMLGRVILTAVGDARAALLRTPGVYSSVSAGSWKSIDATVLDDRHVALEFVGFHTNWPYQLGQIEGMVTHFGVRPSIDVIVGEHYLRMVVDLKP